MHAGEHRCTTRRRNAHKTDDSQQREVLYQWHPWAGCVVHVHDVIEKASGKVLRCFRDSGGTTRQLELPAWMFDRTACLATQIVPRACVDLVTLTVLWALLADATRPNGPASSNAPVLGAGREPLNPNRRDAHATPRSPSCEPSGASPSARPVRSASRGQLRTAGSCVAAASGGDASSGDGSDGAPPPRTQSRRSQTGPEGGGR